MTSEFDVPTTEILQNLFPNGQIVGISDRLYYTTCLNFFILSFDTPL